MTHVPPPVPFSLRRYVNGSLFPQLLKGMLRLLRLPNSSHPNLEDLTGRRVIQDRTFSKRLMESSRLLSVSRYGISEDKRPLMGEKWPADDPDRKFYVRDEKYRVSESYFFDPDDFKPLLKKSAPDSLPVTIYAYSCLQPHLKIMQSNSCSCDSPFLTHVLIVHSQVASAVAGRGKFSSLRSREFDRDRELMPAPEDESIPLFIRSLLQRLLLHPGQGLRQSLDLEDKEWMRILWQI